MNRDMMNRLFPALFCRLTLLIAAILASGGMAFAQASPLVIDLGDGVTLEVIEIPAGSFIQGSPASEADRDAGESQREVTLSRGFYLGKTEVTRSQFEQFVKQTGYRTESEKGTSGGFGLVGDELVQKREFNWRNPGFVQTGDHPVTGVTYADTLEFLKWLTTKCNRRCELPTEAQWEFACRAGANTAYFNGSEKAQAGDIAWTKSNSAKSTHPVGQTIPNSFGLFDMPGGVWEWCRDWHGPYSDGPARDPVETRSNLGDKPRRVVRGGSWHKDLKNARSAARFRLDPGSRNADVGFRVLVQLDVLAAAQPGGQPGVPVAAERPEDPQAAPGQNVPIPVVPDAVDGSGHGAAVAFGNELPQDGAPMWARLAGQFCCFCFFPLTIGFAAFLIYKVVSRKKAMHEAYDVSAPNPSPERKGSQTSRRASKSQQSQSGRFQIEQDGFWFTTDIEPGSVVRLIYRVSNRPESIEVRYRPDTRGQFVYTGETPSDIQIAKIRTPGESDDVSEAWMDDTPETIMDYDMNRDRPTSQRPKSPPKSDSEPFRGYPSAY